ncbi:hypothetical protein PV10_03446 [Exophiala mesophila]|uniref:Copper homeostasis protein cutC homolog n=1 Tax=Exophiala mesophila TaxID=212818 RepID=A0A0D1X231_EXOME|nr:uncharacterized protein PV10_03446 [Exophiala mesophila]KIV95840.1 hypothetical protein PV10_03446 [Exophiala mesophila]
MAVLEVACFNPSSAIAASTAQVDRIELCSNPTVGGVTPDIEWLAQISDKVDIPINIMVRPRGGNFVYSDPEFDEMKQTIALYKSKAAVNGFVFGILLPNGKVDIVRTSELVQQASPLPCTFHRAFDDTPDLFEALEDAVKCNVGTILTSGGCRTAVDGIDTLAQLVKRAEGRVAIMPGGGVRSENLATLISTTQATAYHSSALVDTEQVANTAEMESMKKIIATIF